jgi:hypothetical protein
MSISSLQSNVQRAHSDIAALSKKLSDISGKLADKSRRLADVQQAASRATSASTQQSKLREAAGLLKDIARLESDKAGVEKQLGSKRKDLHRHEQDLAKEEERERKKMGEADKRRRRELESYHDNLNRQIAAQRAALAEHTSSTQPERNGDDPMKQHDLFISHASEDKEDFVRPLAEALTSRGVVVWYDEFQLRVGDSLRQSIDRGLVSSRFGVVVLSSSFFAKNWPQYELNGMVAREMNGVKVILPIWHKVSKTEVLNYSPTLADKVALNSSLLSIDEIADQLADVVKG